jgi:hypothetical protein
MNLAVVAGLLVLHALAWLVGGVVAAWKLTDWPKRLAYVAACVVTVACSALLVAGIVTTGQTGGWLVVAFIGIYAAWGIERVTVLTRR